jgi:hypothetical protein
MSNARTGIGSRGFDQEVSDLRDTIGWPIWEYCGQKTVEAIEMDLGGRKTLDGICLEMPG